MFFAVIGALIILAVSTAPSQPSLKMDRFGSHVMESNELYFKNLRQFYYARSHREDAGFDFFRYKDRWEGMEQTSDSLRFAIVFNPRMDEAYILAEWHDEPLSDSLFVRMESARGIHELLLPTGGVEDQLLFAQQMYDMLGDDEAKFTYQYKQASGTLYASPDVRSSVKMVLRDYFRLVGAL
jgi:hypothetical protein